MFDSVLIKSKLSSWGNGVCRALLSPVFIGMTEDRVVQGNTVCSGSVKCRKADRTVNHRTDGEWPKIMEVALEFLKVKVRAILQHLSPPLPPQSNWAAFHFEYKTKDRRTLKWTTTEDCRSKGLAKTKAKRQICLWWCPQLSDFRQSLSTKDSERIKAWSLICGYVNIWVIGWKGVLYVGKLKCLLATVVFQKMPKESVSAVILYLRSLA